MEITALKQNDSNHNEMTELEERFMDFLIYDCNVCGVTIVRKDKKDILTDGDMVLSHFDIHRLKKVMFLEDNSVVIKYGQETIRFIAE
ncbi:hypothetical protein FDF26_17090 [Clostridium botulinum]|uniref:hypothetical protein n=1 Tax=Clostridium sp. VAP52 TaxID=2949977 RepID=UPI0013FA07FA|nr:hypothetical protein [Clostridium sp. VAP52]NFT08735.1 hypothetical protein [Clostridium botulinum]